MLHPDSRRLFTDVLAPPAGYVFDSGVAATYSLDVTTLLAVPVQIALPAESGSDGVALLDSLRKTASRLRVFCERGRMLVPRKNHILYSLLEDVVVEVDPPLLGSFHPKVWLLRFVDPSGVQPAVFRLMVSSRNITPDNSWDAALILDGKQGDSTVDLNKPLVSFVLSLCGMAHSEVSASTELLVSSLAESVGSAVWELPQGCFSLLFHLLGPEWGGWLPGSSSSLVVVSPFLSDWAVQQLARTSQVPLAIVSREKAFADVGTSQFRERKVLHEALETEDGEDTPVGGEIGLHAKVYIYREWFNTHVVVGSANATFNGLSGRNIEFMAEVVGKDGKIGQPDSFLLGFGEMLVDFVVNTPEPVEEVDSLLENVRRSLLGIPLCLKCLRDEEGWVLQLEFVEPFCVPEGVMIKAWLITMPETSAVPVLSEEVVRFAVDSPELLTGFVAFSMQYGKSVYRFTLNIPVVGMPEERRIFILRSVIRRSEDFIRYLLMLLGGEEHKLQWLRKLGDLAGWMKRSSAGDPMLLESIVTAMASNPRQLIEVDQLVRDLQGGAGEEEIFPAGFLEFWSVFREMLESGDVIEYPLNP
jgi:hypothetical protein